MQINPHITRHLIWEREREALAAAERSRLAAQLRAANRPSVVSRRRRVRPGPSAKPATRGSA